MCGAVRVGNRTHGKAHAMRYNFLGFYNWPAMSGQLDMFQSFDVFLASDSQLLPRDLCEGCVCWREYSTCRQVQVEDWEDDAVMRGGGGYKGYKDCIAWRNCCPILFFDFIGIKLPELITLEAYEQQQAVG